MTDTGSMLLALLGVVIMVIIISRVPSGNCGGNCRQGRDKCDCKGKE